MKKQYHDKGVVVVNHDDGRIEVKLPRPKFEHLKSISQGVDGIYAFLKEHGIPDTENLKISIELGTGHVCYVYQKPEPKLEPKPKAKPKPKPKPKPKAAK